MAYEFYRGYFRARKKELEGGCAKPVVEMLTMDKILLNNLNWFYDEQNIVNRRLENGENIVNGVMLAIYSRINGNYLGDVMVKLNDRSKGRFSLVIY